MNNPYEKLYAEYGDSPRALDWSEHGQRTRFEVIVDAGIQPHHSVLDVGCGLGHLADFLYQRGHQGTYEGLEIADTLLAAARKHRSNSYFSKVSENWLNEPRALPAADFVVASGILSVKEPHEVFTIEPMVKLIDKCFSACKVACVINMLSDGVDPAKKRDDRIYYPPESVLHFALRKTNKVVLRHDYLPNDFTIILRR